MGLGVPGWRQAPGARSGARPLAPGDGGRGEGARLKGFWWHSIASAKYSSLPTPLEGPGSASPGHRSQGQEAGRSTGPQVLKISPFPRTPLPSGVSGEHQRGIVSARVLVFICASSTKTRPHRWKGGCVCVLCEARTAWEREGG